MVFFHEPLVLEFSIPAIGGNVLIFFIGSDQCLVPQKTRMPHGLIFPNLAIPDVKSQVFFLNLKKNRMNEHGSTVLCPKQRPGLLSDDAVSDKAMRALKRLDGGFCFFPDASVDWARLKSGALESALHISRTHVSDADQRRL